MTSTYKKIPLVTVGLSCARGADIPTLSRLNAPATPRSAADSVVLMIEIRALTKTLWPATAVSDLTFTARPGVVTGFLGPNGAGKSTTMRMILGLDEPTSGPVMVIRPAAGRGLLPATWAADVTKYLPATAGQALTTIQPDPARRH